MKKVTLFRLTNSGDTSSTTDRIDFNDPALGKRTNVEKGFITDISVKSNDGVGENQSVALPNGDLQALGPIDNLIILEGFISVRSGDSDDGNNDYLTLLNTWKKEPKVNDSWKNGRFGLIDNGDHNNDLIPVRTGSDQKGLIWVGYDKKSDLKANREFFKLYFKIGKGDGT